MKTKVFNSLFAGLCVVALFWQAVGWTEIKNIFNGLGCMFYLNVGTLMGDFFGTVLVF